MAFYIPATYQMGSPSFYGFLDLITFLLARKSPKFPAKHQLRGLEMDGEGAEAELPSEPSLLYPSLSSA